MTPAAQRLRQLLVALDQGTQWDEMDQLWLDLLLEFDGMPEEHVVDRLGGPLQRRDRNALAEDIMRSIQFMTTRVRDTTVRVDWK